ncbi:MAG: inositol monophosphatase family protein [Verrucomicrobiales bacterium]
MSSPPPLEAAIAAAQLAGSLLRENYGTELIVDELKHHDIKLNLDVRCQRLIAAQLLGAFPDHEMLGEEGNDGVSGAEYQWIVDPLDGTVNYFYGIPHFCVSIGLRRRGEIILGVVFDPMMNELFTVEKAGRPTRNGKTIAVSARSELAEAIITVGFSKTAQSIQQGGARFVRLAPLVRKTRILGSAALAMAYVACGRLDAYIEESVSLWDVAAGILLVESAGGRVELRSSRDTPERFSIVASNGRLQGLE